MAKIKIAKVTVRTNSRIEKYNPIDYMNDLKKIPKRWVDFYDQTPRKIKCISNGEQEIMLIKSKPDNIEALDTDDIMYYLEAATSAERLWGNESDVPETGESKIMNPSNIDGKPAFLEEGKEYTFKRGSIDWDTDMGILWIEEMDNDYGYPAFLFEELHDVSPIQRKKSYKEWEKMIDEQIEEEYEDDYDEDDEE